MPTNQQTHEYARQCSRLGTAKLTLTGSEFSCKKSITAASPLSVLRLLTIINSLKYLHTSPVSYRKTLQICFSQLYIGINNNILSITFFSTLFLGSISSYAKHNY